MNPKPPAIMATTPWEGELSDRLAARFGETVTERSSYLGQNFIVVESNRIRQVLEYLHQEEDFEYLVDITAVDYPKRDKRFELVYILYSYGLNDRVRVKAQIADGERPDSVTPVYLAANWLEREVFDMFGIEFGQHPNMRRILLPDEWRGYPLRKEYGITQMDNQWVKDNLGIESGQ